MLNSFSVTGNLGGAPEFKTVGSNNTDLCTFSLAVSQYNGPNKESTTYWVECALWAGLSKFGQDLNTGDRVTVRGPLKVDRYTNSEGKDRTALKIDVREIHTPRRERGESSGERTKRRSTKKSTKKDKLPF